MAAMQWSHKTNLTDEQKADLEKEGIPISDPAKNRERPLKRNNSGQLCQCLARQRKMDNPF